ncbi:BACON domain-containing protein [Butyricimonas faecihominis]|uniref:BACON domain-containing protein n=1 Tax=Butyricimonas faecihominis TaxID=1472416 RepID=UPI0032C06504
MNKFIFSFILLATFFISCGKDSGTNDPNNPNGNGGEQPTLTLSLTELTFKSAGEEKTFTITSNSNWTITNPSTWCKIDPTQGNSNTTITAIADPSEEYDDRNFNLTIKAGEVTKVVTVTQKKKDAIILTKEKYDIPTEGDNIVVEIKSNITYSAIIPEEHKEWIKQIETNQLGRGLETKNLNFEISANPSTDKREGIIVIKDNNSSLTDTIHVYQAQKDELILTQDTYNVSSEGENINVELRGNVDYEVIIPEDVKDWVTQITGRSSRVDNLIFNIAANPTYDNRSAKVIIKDKNSKLADTLNINQTQVNAIILTQEKYEIPSKGQNIKVEVKSNIKYDIIIPDNAREWIKQIQSRALITNIINLSISENTSYEQRAAEIVVKDKNSNLSDTIRITQKQNNTIILTQKKYDIPAEGQQISIEIKSNIEYDILLSPDAEKWVEKIDLSRALATNTLNYNILPNTTYNERKAEIIIKDKDCDLSDTVKIVQAPKSDIFIGDVTFETEQNLIDFKEKGYKQIRGHLTIKGGIIKTLQHLNNLISVIEGDLIVDCSSITNFDGLYGLTKILGNIEFLDGKFSSFEGLNNLTSIEGDFKINTSKKNLNTLTSFKGLNSLKNIGGNFEINSYSINSFTLRGLTSFEGLENLTTIGKDFRLTADESNDYPYYVSALENLSSFKGLNNLKSIGGNFEINSPSIRSFAELSSFEGLENLAIIGNNFIINATLTSLISFKGLDKLHQIGGSLEINSHSLNSLISFEGLENLNSIASNFKINASISSSSINSYSFKALTSFKGLENLKSIGGNFEINASASSGGGGIVHSLNALSSFEGLENLTTIGGNFTITADSDSHTGNGNYTYSYSLNSLKSFKGLNNLKNINGNFEISAISSSHYSASSSHLTSSSANSLNALESFEGLENLSTIGGNFKINTLTKNNKYKSNKTSYSLNTLKSFNGLNNLSSIGKNFEIKADAIITSSSFYSSYLSSLNSLESLEGLNNLISIGGDFIISSSSSENISSLESLKSFNGLNKLNRINGAFYLQEKSSISLNSFEGLENITTIGSNFNLSSKNLISFKGLERLNSINGDLNITYSKALETIEDIKNLQAITGDLFIHDCNMLHNINSFVNLNTVKSISIKNCPKLYDFCAFKIVVKNTDCNFYTESNGYNPTKYQLLNGECSKLPEE